MASPNWFLRWVFGDNPRSWSHWAHVATRWNFYQLDHGEKVPCWKDRTVPTDSVPFDWPGVLADQVVSLAGDGRVNNAGHGGGTPLQRGTAFTRPLTWGYAEWGQQDRTRIPLPESGWYWLTGHPNPTFDRHCTVTSPDGAVHELIQFDPNAGPLLPPFPNQALGWGLWENGQLIDGRATTASGLPRHGYTWGVGSNVNPHAVGLVLADYVGVDGTFHAGDGWPVIGDRFVLDMNSRSYAVNVAAGGERAALAAALVTYGAVVIDRNGWSDAKNPRMRGTVPRPPSLHVQAGSWSARTNLPGFTLALSDLRRCPQ